MDELNLLNYLMESNAEIIDHLFFDIHSYASNSNF